MHTNENNLLHFDGTANYCPANILIDAGASANYLSHSFAQQSNIQIRSLPKPRYVRIPNGEEIEVIGYAYITVHIQNYVTHLDTFVLPIDEYDLILGMPWLQRENPQIDWRTHQFRIRLPNGKTEILNARKRNIQYLNTMGLFYESEPSKHFPLMNYRQAKRALRNPKTIARLFLIRSSSTEPKEPKEREESKDTQDTMRIKESQPGFLEDLVNSYADVFRTELPEGPPPKRSILHTIDTTNAKPINRNPYPLSLLQEKELIKQITDLQNKGLIRVSQSPWGAPILFVRKKDDTWRMVVDYRALNAVTERNTYPLPRIQDCIDRIGIAKYLSKLDLTSGYWQVGIAPEDIPKTAFNTLMGKFEFVVMPFGLTNAPATFQTMMNSILQPFLNKFVIVYLDDILIYSNSKEEHLEHVRTILELLRQNRLYAKPTKCLFAQTELEFCGHIVGNGVVRPCQSKIEVIKQWPTPKNVHDVRQFLGLASYYRRFVKSFARIAAPIYDLLKEEDAAIRKNRQRPIVWNKQCQAAFELLKESLCSEPVLTQPDTSRPFIIETDASDFAIGLSLLQKDPVSNEVHPVAYDGRKLSEAEQKYPVHEKELLAIKHALRIWYPYIENGHTTTVLTDHESLKYLQSMKRPSPRLARWIDEFGQYSLDIQYRPGSKAIVPDSISRRPDFLGTLSMHKEAKWEWAEYMLDFLQSGTVPDNAEIVATLEDEKTNFIIEEDRLYRKTDQNDTVPYISRLERYDFLNFIHNEYGHLGYPGLLGVVGTRGWWPRMKHDIQEFMKYCPACQTAQRSQTRLEREPQMHLASKTILPFDRWHIDLIGQLPATPNGNRWIITAVDYATGWPIAKAIQKADQITIADFIHDEIFLPYGAPKELLSDMGPNLLAPAVEHFLRKLGVKHRTTTPYHPRTNGKVERFNGLLGLILTKYLLGKPTKLWDQYLSQALFACRIRTHSTSKYSPFYLLYGRHPNLPSDDNPPKPIEVPVTDNHHEERIARLVTARTQANELAYERAMNHAKIRDKLVKLTPFKPGDWVLVRHESPQKFESRWFGPYQVLKRQPLGTYELTDPKDRPLRNLINGQRLVKAHIKGGSIENLWSSPFMQGQLRKQNIIVEPPTPEIREILEAEEPIPPRYHELATKKQRIKKAEKAKILQQANEKGQPAVEHANEQELAEPHRSDPASSNPDTLEPVENTPLSEEYINEISPEERIIEIEDEETGIVENDNAEPVQEDSDLAAADTIQDVVEEEENQTGEEALPVSTPNIKPPRSNHSQQSDKQKRKYKKRTNRTIEPNRNRSMGPYSLRTRPKPKHLL